MGSVIATMQESCEMRHKDVITRSQVLGWVTGIALAVLGAMFAAGMAQMRLTAVEAVQADLVAQVRVVEAERTKTAIELATIKNDLAWQNETLRLIAGKLDVDVPSKR